MICLCACSIGYFFGPMEIWKRVFIFIGVALLMHPGTVTDILGTAIVIVMYFIQRKEFKKSTPPAAAVE